MGKSGTVKKNPFNYLDRWWIVGLLTAYGVNVTKLDIEKSNFFVTKIIPTNFNFCHFVGPKIFTPTLQPIAEKQEAGK